MKNDKKHLIEIYRTIEKKLKTLNFSDFFPGFQIMDFALYNDKIVVLKDEVIPYDRRFVGNTSIIYNNKRIAIWKIESIYVHFNILTSKIVHEMFHAWQMESGELRFPNEFKGLFYHYEKYNISMKFDETKLLLKAFENEDFEALKQFKTLREKRRLDYGFELGYEEGIETIEGMATFVELEALEHLDPSDFQKAYDKLKESIKNIGHYIPIRAVAYDIGALMLLTAKKYHMDFSHIIGKEKQNIYEIIFNDVETIEFYYENSLVDLNFLDAYYQDTLAKISDILTNSPKVYQCDQVIGFDPLNTFRINQYIYYKHFVMIKSRGEQVFVPTAAVGEINDLQEVFVIYQKTI